MDFQKCLASSLLCQLKGVWGEGKVKREGGRENQKYNTIQYTILTAAQYIHTTSKTSTDAMPHFKLTFQYLSNE
jgi:hypothetical protein